MLKKMSMLVHFDSINVNMIEDTSGIFIGTNTQIGWDSSVKSNTALGHISGKLNCFTHNINVVYDNDMVDNYINDRDVNLNL